MRRFLSILAVLSLAFTSSAEATTISGAEGSFQKWMKVSHVPGPMLDIKVEISDAPCGITDPDVEGCALRDEPRIILRPGSSRFVFAHEVGHQFDFHVLKPHDRDRLREIFGKPLPWIGVLEENFADLWAFCSIYSPNVRKLYPLLHVGKDENEVSLGRSAIRKGCQVIEDALPFHKPKRAKRRVTTQS